MATKHSLFLSVLIPLGTSFACNTQHDDGTDGRPTAQALQEKVAQQQPEQEEPTFNLTAAKKSDWHPVWVFVEGGRLKDSAKWDLTFSSADVKFGGGALLEARKQGDRAGQGAGDTVVASVTTYGGADGFWVWAHEGKPVTIKGTVKFQGAAKALAVSQTFTVKTGLYGPIRYVAQKNKEEGLILSYVQGVGKGPANGGGTTTGGTTGSTTGGTTTGGTTTGGTTTGGTTGSTTGGTTTGGDGGTTTGGTTTGGDGGAGDGGGGDSVGGTTGSDGGCADGGCGGG